LKEESRNIVSGTIDNPQLTQFHVTQFKNQAVLQKYKGEVMFWQGTPKLSFWELKAQRDESGGRILWCCDLSDSGVMLSAF
jgi:hypothetical protein